MSVNKVNKTTGDLSLLAGGTLYADSPIGSIIPYGGATAPAGWFICDGTELVRATYPELFAVIGTSFGTPSDNTKFKLPDLREATTKGVGLTGKSNNHYDADGLALGEFIDDRIQEHTHHAKFTDEEGLLAAQGLAYGVVVRDPVGQLTGINASGSFGATTEVKAVGVNYIIKAVSVGIPADFISAVDSALANIGTSGITESSALANIGTSANATQHAVNVAVNDNALLSKADPVGGGQTFNGDLNDLTSPGVYSLVTTSHTPKPGTFYGTALVYKGKFNYLNQEVIEVVTARKWVRARTENGNWSDWRELNSDPTFLYLRTEDLGITVGSTISLDSFFSILWSYLSARRSQTKEGYFNVSGMFDWHDVGGFYITDGNETLATSGAKFDLIIRHDVWSINGGTFLTADGNAWSVRTKFRLPISDFENTILKMTGT